MGKTRSGLGFYRVNRDLISLRGKSVKDQIGIILREINERLVEKDEGQYEILNLAKNRDDNIVLAIRKRSGLAWFEFLKNNLETEIDAEIFEEKRVDIIVFLALENDIISFGSGSTWHFLMSYCDHEFPFEVAKRIFKPTASQATSRSVSGPIYQEDSKFRNSYKPFGLEAFQKIWSKFVSRIDSEIVNSYKILNTVPGMMENWNGEVKSSFVVKRALSFEQAIQYGKALIEVSHEGITADREKAWEVWDNIREINDNDICEELWLTLFENLFKTIKESKSIDLDFCYPKEANVYLSSSLYWIAGQKKVSWDFPPNVMQVITRLPKEVRECSNVAEFKEAIQDLYFCFNDEEPNSVKRKCLHKFFHGSIEMNEKVFFLVDEKWYELKDYFLKNLKSIFENMLNDKKYFWTGVEFRSWQNGTRFGKSVITGKNHDEARYNEFQSREDGFYYGDMIFAQEGRGKVELFDILYTKDPDKVYVIQVKNGFGASVRDACSQIRLAAEVIMRSKVDDSDLLDSYFEKWQNIPVNKGLNRKEFKGFFSRKIVFVLAFVHKHEFEAKNISRFASHIARYEIQNTAHYFSSNSWSFQIARIPFD
jgi:uncharacterized protein (TIGR04141 family)